VSIVETEKKESGIYVSIDEKKNRALSHVHHPTMLPVHPTKEPVRTHDWGLVYSYDFIQTCCFNDL
jgi:hypothetical protein